MFKKKFLGAMICVFAISSNVFASDFSNNFVSGDSVSAEEATPYVYSQEELKLLNEKLAALENSNGRYIPDGEYITLPIPVFQQETDYYCGPATTKQVVDYLNGWSDTQKNIATALHTSEDGTTMPYIADYLNSVTNKSYIYQENVTQDFYRWLDIIEASIKNKKPAILDIRIDNTSVFPYRTNGHYVNVSGFDTKHSYGEIRITDPFGPGLGNKWYTWSDLHEVNNNHWRKAVIW